MGLERLREVALVVKPADQGHLADLAGETARIRALIAEEF